MLKSKKKQIGPFSLAELAEKLGGRLDNSAPESRSNVMIGGIASIVDAVEEDITFFSTAKKSSQHLEQLKLSRAGAVIASEDSGPLPLPAIRFPKEYLGFMKAMWLFFPAPTWKPGIHPTAFVHEDADVDELASIGPMAVVEEFAVVGKGTRVDAQSFVGAHARIGASSWLHPQVTFHRHCRLGNGSIIHSGTVIGSDGFGFYSDRNGHQKIPQAGIVTIGDKVEIGANVTIDRATLGATVIGDGTQIDNLVHIAHNCVIGKHCVIVGQAGISGSTILEDFVTMAGQAGTAGHVTVGKGATVAARGVVTQDVAPGSLVSGFPLKPHSEEKRIMIALRRLPDLLKRVRNLEKPVQEEK